MPHLRTYIAGLGTSGALIAAVLVASLTLGGIVAVNGLPERSEPASDGSVLVQVDQREGEAGTAVRATAEAPPERRGDDASPATDGERGGRGDESVPGPTEGTPQPVAPAPTDPPGLTAPPNPPQQPPADSKPPPPPRPAPPSGPVGGLVEEADGTAGDIVGFHPGIAEAIVPITGPIDDAMASPSPIPEPTGADSGN